MHQSASGPAANRFAARFDRHLGTWLLIAGLLLAAGWVLPAMTLRQLIVLSDEVSIMGAILRLLDGGEFALFALVFTFTVVVPSAKLAIAFLVWRRLAAPRPHLERLLGWVEAFGRWSMLDVFVIALFVVVVKISAFSDVTIHAGLYVFAAAVGLSIVVVRRIARQAASRAQEEARRRHRPRTPSSDSIAE